MSTRRKPVDEAGRLRRLIGADIELRTAGGGAYRGELQGVGDNYFIITRATTGRVMLIRREAVSAIVDETPVGLQTVSRRDAGGGA